MTNDKIRSFLDQSAHAWQRRDAAALGACFTDDCVVVSPIFRTLKAGRRSKSRTSMCSRPSNHRPSASISTGMLMQLGLLRAKPA